MVGLRLRHGRTGWLPGPPSRFLVGQTEGSWAVGRALRVALAGRTIAWAKRKGQRMRSERDDIQGRACRVRGVIGLAESAAFPRSPRVAGGIRPPSRLGLDGSEGPDIAGRPAIA